MSVLMWVVVSSKSSMVVSTGTMSIGLNLLDNGIGSFISVFCLDFFFSLFRVFFPDFGCVCYIYLKLLKCVP